MNYAIIAAGNGSRLLQEGVNLPKPLVELNGISLIDRLMRIFIQNNAESISIIVNEKMEAVQKYIKNLQLSVPLNLVIKSTPSSMHSFFELSRFLLSDKFCLTTVDPIFKENEFSAFIRSFEENKDEDGMMAVTDYIDDEKPLYVSVDENSGIINGFWDVSEGKEKYVSGGIYALTPKAIEVLNQCLKLGLSSMRNYQRQLINKGLKLKAYPFTKIIDVDHAEDIVKAEAFLKESTQ